MNSYISLHDYLTSAENDGGMEAVYNGFISLAVWLRSDDGKLIGLWDGCRREFISEIDALTYLNDCKFALEENGEDISVLPKTRQVYKEMSGLPWLLPLSAHEVCFNKEDFNRIIQETRESHPKVGYLLQSYEDTESESARQSIINPTTDQENPKSEYAQMDQQSSHQSSEGEDQFKYDLSSRADKDGLSVFRKMGNLQPYEITITFSPNQRLKIEARNETRYVVTGAVDLLNKKTGCLNKQGGVLLGLSKKQILPNIPANHKSISRLRKEFFKEHLGTITDPFKPYRKGVGWEPNFTVRDQQNAADERAREKAHHVSYDDNYNYNQNVLDSGEEDDDTEQFLRGHDPTYRK